ncbi:MAG: hypothetical protein RLZZ214_263 [Verrucomicrobiota bacterium]
MKALISTGCVVGGLAIGILLGRGPLASAPAPRKDAASEPARTRPTKPERPATASSRQTGVSKIRQADPAQIAALTRQVAAMSDPVELKRLLAECLLNMTADNWRDVVACFNNLSTETGRDPADEWKLALFRSGQIAGGEAMDSYLAAGLKNRGTESWQTLYGWGTKDPLAALAWLKQAEADGHATSSENYTAVISGLALTDPQAALKLIAEIPAERRNGLAGNFVWNVVQNGGIEALDPVLQYASTMDPADSGSAALAGDLFREVTEKLLWKADHARDVGQACEVITKLTAYGRDPNELTRAALRKYRYYYMPDKLNILDTVSAGPQGSELQLASLTSTVVSTMNGEGDRTAVAEWMKQHPDSPLIPHLKPKVSPEP